MLADKFSGIVSPETVSRYVNAKVMAEIGVDLSTAYPKPLTDDGLRAADVVVTMGCGEACPVIDGKRYLDWDIAYPDDADLDTLRAMRDDIDARVRARLAELTA